MPYLNHDMKDDRFQYLSVHVPSAEKLGGTKIRCRGRMGRGTVRGMSSFFQIYE